MPEDVVKDRFDRLLKEVQEIARETSSRYTGQVVEVLAEEKIITRKQVISPAVFPTIFSFISEEY